MTLSLGSIRVRMYETLEAAMMYDRIWEYFYNRVQNLSRASSVDDRVWILLF